MSKVFRADNLHVSKRGKKKKKEYEFGIKTAADSYD